MEQKQYKIIFNGGIVPSHDVERVKNNLASLFKTSASALDGLFQDRLVVIRKNLSLEEADRYREAVERVGGYCIIERMDETARDSVMNLSARSEKMVCPKCHYVQSKTPVCSSCGVIVEEYRKRIEEDREAVLALLDRQQATQPSPAEKPEIRSTLDTDSEQSSLTPPARRP